MRKLTPEGLIVALVLVVLAAGVAYWNLRTGLIPDVVTLPGIVVGVALNAVLLHRFWASLAGAVVGFAISFAVSELYYRRRRVEGLGFGVVKEATMIGAFLGVVGVCVCLAAAFVCGVGYAYLPGRKRNVIQFAPFLLIGVLVFLGLSALWLP